MNVEFHCPHLNRMVTDRECYDMEETPLCEACTSEMDTSRKALYDWLTASYGDRFAVAMKEDGIEISVHDRMTVLADPCDEDGDTYVGVECGEAGGTHFHPLDDMQTHIASLLEGQRVIGLGGEGGSSCISWKELCVREPEQIAMYQTIVDAEGVYTPEEYAAKLGVLLLGKELRFYCPAENAEITETACEERCRRWRRGKVCRACAGEAQQQAAVEYIAGKLLPHCGGVKLKRSSDRKTLHLMVHEGLRIDLAPTGLDSEGYMEIRLEGRSFTHDHPTGREMLEGLIPFLQGVDVLVLSSGASWAGQTFVTLRELRDDWQGLTKGRYVRICDRLGVWEKDVYRKHMMGEEQNPSSH